MTERWKETRQFIDEALEQSTRDKYDSHLRSYFEFCRKIGARIDDPKSVAMYVFTLSRDVYAQSSINGAVSAISNHFRFAKDNPVNSPYVTQAKKSALKKAPLVRQRDELTKAHLRTWGLSVNRNSFTDVRDFTMVLFAFRGMLRGSEVAALRAEDVFIGSIDRNIPSAELFPIDLFGSEILHIVITSSKTNPQSQKPVEHRKSESVLIGRDTDPLLDPILWYARFNAKRSQAAEAFFHSFTTPPGFLSSRSFNHIVKNRLADEGVDVSNLGGHSARAGGATAAALANVDTRAIMKHGRWKSSAVNLYIRDSTVSALNLNAAMGGFVTSQPASAASTAASAPVPNPKPHD